MTKYNFEVAEHVATAGKIEQCPANDLPEIIMAGKSNVGKSSLINALTNKKGLARVSQSPGKTKLIIYFMVDKAFYLTDLPGYGYAKASQTEIAKFSSLADDYLHSDRRIALILLLMDIRTGPSVQDSQMLEWLDYHGMEHMVIFTKADKFSKAKANTEVYKMIREKKIPEHTQYHIVSSSKKIGIDELREIISRKVFELS